MDKNNIKKACGIVDKAFLYVLKTIKTGEYEKSLALRIDNFIKNKGAKLSFPTIVGSGSHSAFIHHKPCNRKIRKNEPILLDFGAKVDNFCSDISRTIFIGNPSKEFENMYKLVLKVQKLAINKLNSGVGAKNIDLIARKIINKKGFGKHFKHALGHGLGEKVHQAPSISPNSLDLLKVNDIVTIEPGVYFKGKGGIRIEDDIIIKEKGYKILTKAPKEFKEIIINEKV